MLSRTPRFIVIFVSNRAPPFPHAYFPPRRPRRALNSLSGRSPILRGAVEIIRRELDDIVEEDDLDEGDDAEIGVADDIVDDAKTATSIVVHRIQSWAAYLQPVASDAEKGDSKIRVTVMSVRRPQGMPKAAHMRYQMNRWQPLRK